MATNLPHKQQFRQLIGRRVIHRGRHCTVIELLEQESALVLEEHAEGVTLQDNQYGNPGRRVTQTYTIPLFDEERPDQWHPALLQLGLFSD